MGSRGGGRSQNLHETLSDAKNTKKHVYEVIAALKSLGGSACGEDIVNYFCRLESFLFHFCHGEKGKLRYCVNGLLSARVNAKYFNKRPIGNGVSRTLWSLRDQNENDDEQVAPDSHHDSENEDTEKDETEQPSESEVEVVEVPTTPQTKRRSMRIIQSSVLGTTRKPSRYSESAENPFRSREVLGHSVCEEENEDEDIEEDSFDVGNCGKQEILQSKREKGSYFTFHEMVEEALEKMGSCDFSQIVEFIECNFKEQLEGSKVDWRTCVSGFLEAFNPQKATFGNTDGEPLSPRKRNRNAEGLHVTRSFTKRRRGYNPTTSVVPQEVEVNSEDLSLIRTLVSRPYCCFEMKNTLKRRLPCGHETCNNKLCSAYHVCKTCNAVVRDSAQEKSILELLADVAISSPKFGVASCS